MVKIAHFADVHLASALSAHPDKRIAAQRREEILRSFFAALDFCAEQGVHLVLIAGDLFDNPASGPAEAARTARYMGRFPDLLFFIAPGNHDCLSRGCVYDTVDWPQNVYIFRGEEVSCVDLPQYHAAVYGAGFTAFETGPILENFRAPDDGRIHLMALHGDIRPGAVHNPISTEQIERSGLTYLALGHIHTRDGVKRAGRTTYAYPGCFEPRGFDEPGEKGFLLGVADEEGCRMEFVPWSKRRYEEITLDVSGMESLDELYDAVLSTPGREEKACRIKLTGSAPRSFYLHPKQLNEHFASSFFTVSFQDRTGVSTDYRTLSREKNLTGVFLKNLLDELDAAKKDEEREQILLAMRYGVEALTGKGALLP